MTKKLTSKQSRDIESIMYFIPQRMSHIKITDKDAEVIESVYEQQEFQT